MPVPQLLLTVDNKKLKGYYTIHVLSQLLCILVMLYVFSIRD